MREYVLAWQFYTELRIRWRNQVWGAYRRRRDMRRRDQIRRLEWASLHSDQYWRQAEAILARTRRQYPWARGAFAMGLPSELENPLANKPGAPYYYVESYPSVQAALTAAAGSLLIFGSATYDLGTGTLVVSAGTTLRFNSSTLKVVGAPAGGLFNVNAGDIVLEGTYSVTGATFATDVFVGGSSTTRFLHDAAAQCNNLGTANSLIQITAGSNIKIDGLLTTTSNRLVFLKGCSRQEVAGCQVGPLTRNLAASTGIVQIWDNGTAAPPNLSSVHDILIDEGAFLNYAAVAIAQSFGGGTHGVGATANNILITNGGATGDGVDIVQVDNVTEQNINVKAVNNGINIAGCVQVSATGGTAINCNSAGCQVGDPTVAFATSLVTVNGFIMVDCGVGGQVDFTAAGLTLFAPAGASTNVVTLVNCQSFKSANTNMKYGLGMGNGAAGTFSSCSVSGGFYLGNTAPYLDSATVKPAATIRGAAGICPQGTVVVTPGFPLSTVNVTNTTGFDVMSTIVNGTSAMTNISVGGQTISGSLPASATLTIIITAGNTFKCTYAGGAPSHIWYGL